MTPTFRPDARRSDSADSAARPSLDMFVAVTLKPPEREPSNDSGLVVAAQTANGFPGCAECPLCRSQGVPQRPKEPRSWMPAVLSLVKTERGPTVSAKVACPSDRRGKLACQVRHILNGKD